MKHIAILLTVHNRKQKTISCLQNIYSQVIAAGYSMRVFMTNDGCTDGTPDAVRELFPYVTIIDGDGNLFWNRGMWTAWSCASSKREYDYYLWLNDDTHILENCLSTIIMASKDKDDKAIIVGPTVDSATRKVITYGGRVGKGLVIPNGEMAQVERFNGNIVLVPNFVFQKLGNLDYYFTHSKGDIDYGKRATKAGIEIWQVGKPLGICDVHPHIDRWCDPEIPFKKRWKLLNMPNGMPPNETFHLEKRHDGLLIAFIHYCSTVLHCLFPSLWIAMGKTKNPQQQ